MFFVIVIICLAALLIFAIHTQSPLPNSAVGVASEIKGAEVSKHNKSTDCWTSIGGSVYDLSVYFNANPDQDASKFCGLIEPGATLPTNLKAETLSTYSIGVLTP